MKNKTLALLAMSMLALASTRMHAAEDYAALAGRQARTVTHPDQAALLLNQDHRQALADQAAKGGVVYGRGVSDIHQTILRNLPKDILAKLPTQKLIPDAAFSVTTSSQLEGLSQAARADLYRQLSESDAQGLIKNTTLGDEIQAARAAQPQSATAAAAVAQPSGEPEEDALEGFLRAHNQSPEKTERAFPVADAQPAVATAAAARPQPVKTILTALDSRRPDAATIQALTLEQLRQSLQAPTAETLKNLQYITQEQASAIAQDPTIVLTRSALRALAPKIQNSNDVVTLLSRNNAKIVREAGLSFGDMSDEKYNAQCKELILASVPQNLAFVAQLTEHPETPFALINKASHIAPILTDPERILSLLNADFTEFLKFIKPEEEFGSGARKAISLPMASFNQTIKTTILNNLKPDVLQELPVEKIDPSILKSLPSRVIARFSAPQQTAIRRILGS